MHAHHTLGFVELEPLAVAGVDLVIMIVALVCLMILFGFWVIATILNDLFGSFSIFGFHPFGFVKGLLDGVMKKNAGWLDNASRGFARFLWSQVMTIWRFVYVATDVMVGMYSQLLNNVQLIFQHIFGETDRATSAENQLYKQEQQDFSNLQNSVTNQFGLLNGAIAQDYAQLQNEINNLQNQINALPTTDLGSIENELHADVNGLQSQINGLNTTVANNLAADQTNLTNQLAGLRTILEQEITNGVQTAENYATGLVSGVGVGSILQTLQSLQQRLSKVETDTAECLDPLCADVTPNAPRLGRNLNWLKNLEALGFEAALFALAAECLTNPQAVVTDVTTVVDDVGQPIMDAGKALIGL